MRGSVSSPFHHQPCTDHLLPKTSTYRPPPSTPYHLRGSEAFGTVKHSARILFRFSVFFFLSLPRVCRILLPTYLPSPCLPHPSGSVPHAGTADFDQGGKQRGRHRPRARGTPPEPTKGRAETAPEGASAKKCNPPRRARRNRLVQVLNTRVHGVVGRCQLCMRCLDDDDDKVDLVPGNHYTIAEEGAKIVFSARKKILVSKMYQ